MYNATTLKTSLINLVGWRQNPDSTGTQLTTGLTTDSGLYFNDVHPLLTFDNIESIAPQFTGFDISTWLQQKTEAGIIGAVEDWIRAKFEMRTAKSLIESEKVFSAVTRPGNLDINQSRLVGLEVLPPFGRGIKTVIERIAIQLSQAQSITIRLYRDGKAGYLNTTDINYTIANDVQWVDVNWEIGRTGAYYVVYEQTSLTGQSINGTTDYTATGFYRAGVGYTPYYPAGKYVKVTPFSNPGTFGSLDPASNSYNVVTNYGLNLEFSAKCDYTDFVIRHKDILKSLIQKRVGIDLLREMAYNPNTRVNRHESNASLEQILYEIDGDSQGVKQGGLKYQYDMELKSTSMDQTAIDPFCAPCRKRSVKYKAI